MCRLFIIQSVPNSNSNAKHKYHYASSMTTTWRPNINRNSRSTWKHHDQLQQPSSKSAPIININLRHLKQHPATLETVISNCQTHSACWTPHTGSRKNAVKQARRENTGISDEPFANVFLQKTKHLYRLFASVLLRQFLAWTIRDRFAPEIPRIHY